MDEYIGREEAKRYFNLNFGGVSHAIIASRLLDEIPTADVAPVRHGRWVFTGICTACSECGSNKPTKAHDHKLANKEIRFCYFCGAVMDLEDCNA